MYLAKEIMLVQIIQLWKRREGRLNAKVISNAQTVINVAM